MLLKSLGEERLVSSLARRFAGARGLVKGIGDDTSVTAQRGGWLLLATTDTLAEGTHFDLGYTPPALLGRKALSISLSDIAAMGGRARFFLVSLALPSRTEKRFVERLYDGLEAASKEYGCPLAGGNTSRSDKVMVSTTVIGEAPKGKAIYRSGARAGDLIFVTGELGSSALGLKTLSTHGRSAVGRGPWRGSVARHLDPAPRLAAGWGLSKAGLATAMMDISDGLGLDLTRLLKESNKAGAVYIGSLPISNELRDYSERTGKDVLLDFALTGGEDYELLFTSPESNLKKISALSRRLGLAMTPVGKVLGKAASARTLTVIGEDGRPLELKRLGFEHF